MAGGIAPVPIGRQGSQADQMVGPSDSRRLVNIQANTVSRAVEETRLSSLLFTALVALLLEQIDDRLMNVLTVHLRPQVANGMGLRG